VDKCIELIVTDDHVLASEEFAQLSQAAARRSFKVLVILFLLEHIFCLIVVVYSIWEDLAAWKLLLNGVALICLQVWNKYQT
jgi:hypothetical protein